MTAFFTAKRALPGLALCAGIALLAFGLERWEIAVWGHAWLEALVLAILAGALVRTSLPLPDHAQTGIRIAAKSVMEAAVALMGASTSLGVLANTGVALIAAIAGTIALTIAVGYRIGRALGLSDRMAMLVACGNAICGNSAIAAVAPAIDADGKDVSAAIGFTAVMGIGVVLGVAPLAVALKLSAVQGGMLAGMTVYAVPQVLAAANPLGVVAVQTGAVVKLVRVLMLAPVVAILSHIYGNELSRPDKGGVGRFVPGFILIFVALAVLRSAGAIPDGAAAIAHNASLLLTVLAMAGLGLGVDLRLVVAAGPRVTASVAASLIVLVVGALGVIRLLG